VKENLERFVYCLFISVLSLRSKYQKWRVGTPYFWVYHKPGFGFATPYVAVLFCAQWFEVVVHVFDIDGVVDHHYLNFLVIIMK
jgi:hypothetical protein